MDTIISTRKESGGFEDEYFIGDTISVDYKTIESDRIYNFTGILTAKTNKKIASSILVVKYDSSRIYVSMRFKLSSPLLVKIKKIASPKKTTRRSKLYYLVKNKK
jgi:ribosomal protein L19